MAAAHPRTSRGRVRRARGSGRDRRGRNARGAAARRDRAWRRTAHRHRRPRTGAASRRRGAKRRGDRADSGRRYAGTRIPSPRSVSPAPVFRPAARSHSSTRYRLPYANFRGKAGGVSPFSRMARAHSCWPRAPAGASCRPGRFGLEQGAMKLRNLGQSGLKVSAVGVGCNNIGGRLDRDGTMKLVPAAIDLGITLFDTADSYPVGKPGVSETLLGEALGDRRKDVVIATKFANVMGPGEMMRGGSRRWIMQAVEGSLRRLKTDWIDLYQMHFPDPNTPIDETLRALDDVIRAGKVRYIGCSNFAGWQIATARAVSRELGVNVFASDQDEYSILVREVEREIIPAARANGMGFLPYFPLASGFLTGKYKRNAPMPQGARITAAKIFQDNYLTDE